MTTSASVADELERQAEQNELESDIGHQASPAARGERG